MDYIGNKNFPSVTSRKLLLNFFKGEKGYKKAAEQWIKEKEENVEKICDVIIEN